MNIHQYDLTPICVPVKVVHISQGRVPLALRGTQEPPIAGEAAEVVVSDGLEEVTRGQVPHLYTGGDACGQEVGWVEQHCCVEPSIVLFVKNAKRHLLTFSLPEPIFLMKPFDSISQTSSALLVPAKCNIVFS